MVAFPRRKFALRFKGHTADGAKQSNRPTVEKAEEVTLSPALLRNWVTTYETDKIHQKYKKLSPVDLSRLTELEAEVRRLQMENEFLRKAAMLHPGA